MARRPPGIANTLGQGNLRALVWHHRLLRPRPSGRRNDISGRRRARWGRWGEALSIGLLSGAPKPMSHPVVRQGGVKVKCESKPLFARNAQSPKNGETPLASRAEAEVQMPPGCAQDRRAEDVMLHRIRPQRTAPHRTPPRKPQPPPDNAQGLLLCGALPPAIWIGPWPKPKPEVWLASSAWHADDGLGPAAACLWASCSRTGSRF